MIQKDPFEATEIFTTQPSRTQNGAKALGNLLGTLGMYGIRIIFMVPFAILFLVGSVLRHIGLYFCRALQPKGTSTKLGKTIK